MRLGRDLYLLDAGSNKLQIVKIVKRHYRSGSERSKGKS